LKYFHRCLKSSTAAWIVQLHLIGIKKSNNK
jgi:hypothetical protein